MHRSGEDQYHNISLSPKPNLLFSVAAVDLWRLGGSGCVPTVSLVCSGTVVVGIVEKLSSAVCSSSLLPYPIPSGFPLSLSCISHLASTHPPTQATKTARTATQSSCTLQQKGQKRALLALVWELRGDGHGPVVACGVDDGRLGKQGITVSGHRRTKIVYSPRHARGIATSSSGGLWHSTPPLVLPVHVLDVPGSKNCPKRAACRLIGTLLLAREACNGDTHHQLPRYSAGYSSGHPTAFILGLGLQVSTLGVLVSAGG